MTPFIMSLISVAAACQLLTVVSQLVPHAPSGVRQAIDHVDRPFGVRSVAQRQNLTCRDITALKYSKVPSRAARSDDQFRQIEPAPSTS